MTAPDLLRPPLVTLVPQSGLQFLSLSIDLADASSPNVAFQEMPRPDLPAPAGMVQVELKRVTTAELEALRGPDKTLPPEAYTVKPDDALASFANDWVPLPYLKIRSADASGRLTFEKGPSNWVRARIEPEDAAATEQTRFRVLIAIDTAFVPRVDGGPFTGLAAEEGEPEFGLCHEPADVAWFVAERWVDPWLREMYVTAREASLGRKLRESDFRNPNIHRAHYLMVLAILARTGRLPRLRLIDIVSSELPYTPVDVDLVLDIGNARTCGVLIETSSAHQGGGAVNLNESYPLRLRDLGRPERAHEEPFESRVEFARVAFGRDNLSRISGRTNAFAWPSPVRVGPEAIRLSASAPGNGGPTGLSSPKRYLWDTRAQSLPWRFNVPSADAQEPPVSGAFMRFVREDGEIIGIEGGSVAMRARFSRSSMFALMLTELLLQAIAQINAPDTRARRDPKEIPRRLRSVILTMPTAMPLAEQRLLRKRAEGAVQLVWDLLGWSGKVDHAPRQPRVVADLDEATATQLVFLYTEVTQRLKGNLGWFLSLSGRERDGVRSVRIASVDIGGGTTDLMIATYAADQGDALVPTQNFREGFKVAGDDVLRQVVEEIVLSQVSQALAAAGMRRAPEFLAGFFAADRGEESTTMRYLRLQVVARVLEPVATAILGADERRSEDSRGEILRGKVSDYLANAALAERAIAHFDERAQAAGAPGFSLADVEITATADAVAEAVRVVIGGTLADLCEAVHSLGCDWLLLSGRPSRLRAVREIVLARLPVAVHRIVPMHRYEVGNWYPFRDDSGRIADPKTSVAVGAMLATLAEGRLDGFFLESSRLVMRSTARYFGRLDANNQLSPEDTIIEQLDLDTRLRQRAVLKAVSMQRPMFLGFKQLPLRRWPATALYRLDWADGDRVSRYKLPLRVTLRRDEIDAEDRHEADPASRRARELQREDFVIHAIEDRNRDEVPTGEVLLRLQTMTQDVYWRDTGALTVAKS